MKGGEGFDETVSSYADASLKRGNEANNERRYEIDVYIWLLATCSSQFEQRESVAASWRIDESRATLLSPGADTPMARAAGRWDAEAKNKAENVRCTG